MTKKTIKLTEKQLQMLTEARVNEVTAIDIADVLKSIECTGEGIKSLIRKKLINYGFVDVNIKFLGYSGDKKDLKYIVHTEGPIFVIDTRSNTDVEVPCMEVMSVVAYTQA